MLKPTQKALKYIHKFVECYDIFTVPTSVMQAVSGNARVTHIRALGTVAVLASSSRYAQKETAGGSSSAGSVVAPRRQGAPQEGCK